MKLENRIKAFSKLGKLLSSLSEDEFKLWSVNAQSLNQWFTEDNVKLAIDGVIAYLDEEKLLKWVANYNLENPSQKNIGVVMAGNIPLVGFHDYLSVLMSGNHISIKLSSNDNYLLKMIHQKLVEIEPFFSNKVQFADRLNEVDGYIATGSNNSSRYFEYYFSKKPNIIRKNRTSIAVLTGEESTETLQKLTKDIFHYFGLGCRNVTFLLVPENYNWEKFFKVCEEWKDIIHHSKYLNNYEYSRSVLLVKQVPHLDNGFLILKEDQELNSSISVLNYKTYGSPQELESFIQQHENEIQCVVGENFTAFGSAQKPHLWDYADGVDTLDFLTSLK